MQKPTLVAVTFTHEEWGEVETLWVWLGINGWYRWALCATACTFWTPDEEALALERTLQALPQLKHRSPKPQGEPHIPLWFSLRSTDSEVDGVGGAPEAADGGPDTSEGSLFG